MCAIFGMLSRSSAYSTQAERALILACKAKERGRDGVGLAFYRNGEEINVVKIVGSGEQGPALEVPKDQAVPGALFCTLGNTRAEPTTEYVNKKTPDDQQPYALEDWVIVHNGTIANDAELRSHRYPTSIDSAAILEQLVEESEKSSPRRAFDNVVRRLEGSFAILAYSKRTPSTLYVALNYRPLWMCMTDDGCIVASSPEFFNEGRNSMNSVFLEPYKIYSVAAGHDGIQIEETPLHDDWNKRAVVVCSGGLDSTVAAAWAKRYFEDVQLLHFTYGCRAEEKEVLAVARVANDLGLTVEYMSLPGYDEYSSPLLSKDKTFAGGIEGAEFAHEWVPARNLVMLSLATAYAEQHGFETIILGNNMEEAGAYPDNEPEFIHKFNAVLPFAVAAGKKLRVAMPVGNLMKHEIVKLGLEIGAPMDKAWSCYYHGDRHCGQCGPCFMRRTAFEINNEKEVIEYGI